MMSAPHAPDVLVVGAGPTGLVLALELARRGVAVQIVDSAGSAGNSSNARGSRGKGLQPRTLEIFEDLGVLDAVRALAGPYPPLRAYGGPDGATVVWEGQLHEPRPATPGVPYPELLMLPQHHTERILREHLAGYGVTVSDQTTLAGFTAGAVGVTAALTGPNGPRPVQARYLVGADGGRSLVRRELGVGFVGTTRDEERMVIADVRFDQSDPGDESPLDRDHWHLWGNVAAGSLSAGLSPLPGLPGEDVFQLTAPLASGETVPLDLDAVRLLVAERTGRADLNVRAVDWSSLYRVNIRMADRYRVGPVFLAGDAAHVHSPAGGQGLNTGVQDAHNLGWKLAAVLRGAPEALLDTYEAERLPVAADVLGLSTLLLRGGMGTADSDLTDSTDAPKRGRDTDQIDVGYRGGPLSREARSQPPAGDQEAGLQPGDRAPDAPCEDASGKPVRLFDLFRGGVTVLALPGLRPCPALSGPVELLTEWSAQAAVPAAVEVRWVIVGGSATAGAEVIVDSGGHLAAAYGPVGESGLLVVVRPDGYVGLLADAGSPDVVTGYLAELGAASAS
jgi:2-polyprenyl-6-methoxyphenol hydroxylase-like FAD-dependent oxidoreductase